MNNIVNYRLINGSIDQSIDDISDIDDIIDISNIILLDDKKDKTVNIKTVFDLIDLLPYDIKRKIYEDYIRIPYLKSQFYIELNSDNSQRLISKGIYDRYIKMKNIPDLMNYIIKDDEIINRLYIEHFILNKKNFVRLDMDKSFILSILFTLYH
jgi:hypothetical protein